MGGASSSPLVKLIKEEEIKDIGQIQEINNSINQINNKINNFNIQTYTSLEQMGLSDDDMVADDFAENLSKIDNSLLNSPLILVLTFNAGNTSNFCTCLFKKLNDDGFAYSNNTAITVKIERLSVYRNNDIKIELYFDSYSAREKTIICYCNKDGNMMKVYPFKESLMLRKN